MKLKDRVAIVTGSAQGIGRAIADKLAAEGASVVLADLNEAGAKAAAATLPSAIGIRTDVSDEASVKAMVKAAVETYGKLDILVNSAAIVPFTAWDDIDLAEWRRIMAVNLDGMFLVAQAVGQQMIRQGTGGSIIQTASIYGILGADHRIYEGSFYLDRQINTPAVYAASKAAVVGLTRYLAAYWAEQGIRVNTLTPGGVESGQNEAFKARYSARVPLGRMARADEMVGALIYLASDASSYVTGQNLIVDGGLSAW